MLSVHGNRMKRNIRSFIGVAVLLVLCLLVSCDADTPTVKDDQTTTVTTEGNVGTPFEDDANDTSNTTATPADDTSVGNTPESDTDRATDTQSEETTVEEIEEITTRDHDLFDLPLPAGDYALTYENLGELGSKHNVVYFVIDRFDWEYYVRARDKAPEIFYNLDNGGFTYYDDAISLYPRTFPSIAYMITGVENDFSKSRTQYFESAYAGSLFMRRLYNVGYTVNVYTDTYYGYVNAACMANYAANAQPVQNGQTAYSTDMRDIYTYLTKNGVRIGDSERSYTFIHLSGTHLPLLYDENFNPLPEGDAKAKDSTIGLKQSFAIINYYIDAMKRLGVYDNATIIITGDHPSIGSDSAVPLRWAHVTPLFVKPSSSASGALMTSSAPVTHADLFPTILKSEGIEGGMANVGRSVFEIPEGELRERLYYFQKLEKIDGKTNYEMVIFAINGKAADYANWVIRERYYLGKSIYN